MAKEMTLQNGTKLGIKAVPALLVLGITEKFPVPKVPLWHNEDKQRDEENPNDPLYIEAIQKHNQLIQDKTIDCFLLNGVVVQELGPDCEPADSDNWLETTEYLLEVSISRTGAGRRAAWLRHHLIDNANELGDIVAQISIASGLVTEEAVAKAAETFRDNQTGDTDTTVPPASDSGRGDQADGPAWAGDGVRVQGGSQVQLSLVDNLD